MRLVYAAGMVLALVAMAGCIRPYKVEIYQGNVVTRDMIEKLKPGMTKSQVRFVLGTPLIADAFHPERWDYVYVYKKDISAPPETKHLTVIFDGDTMARMEGDLARAPSTAPTEDKLGNGSPPQSGALPSTARAR